jgi:hypothetical protein
MSATTAPGRQRRGPADPSPLRAWLEGWPLVRTTTLVVALASLALVAQGGGLSDATARAVVRLTARVALPLFCAAFAASSLRVFWKTRWSAWLLAQRRYVGVSAAAVHGIHMLAVATAATLDPEHFFVGEGRTLASTAPALVAVVAFALMAATSSDAAVRTLGRRAWRMLHRVCGYLVLIAFAGGFAPRIAQSPFYAVPVALAGAVWALRVAAAARGWLGRRSQGTRAARAWPGRGDAGAPSARS